MPKRTSTAQWQGSVQDGGGSVALGSGAFEGPYSARSRFEDGSGTNPEELIAAAHAGCFSMALSLILGNAGQAPESIVTEADVHINRTDDGWAIDRIDLRTRARVPGLDADEFRRHAETAKENCPVSKALGAVPQINLEAELAG